MGWFFGGDDKPKKRTLGARDKQILYLRAGKKCEACGKKFVAKKYMDVSASERKRDAEKALYYDTRKQQPYACGYKRLGAFLRFSERLLPE